MCKYAITTLRRSQLNEAIKISGEIVEWKSKLIKAMLFGKGIRSFCAVNNNKLIGYAAMHKCGTMATIPTVLVDAKHRRTGVGFALMSAIVYRARKDGIKYISLKTAKDNISAIKLYNKLGFNATRGIRNYFGNGIHAVVMEKEIDTFYAPLVKWQTRSA